MPEERRGMTRQEAGRKGGQANRGTTHASHGQGRVIDPAHDRRTKQSQQRAGQGGA